MADERNDLKFVGVKGLPRRGVPYRLLHDVTAGYLDG
jgi:hypothetical protein